MMLNEKLNFSWSCFILLGTLILRIILINSFADEVNTPSALIKTCMRIFGFALICSILFKIDNLSEFSWTNTFWYFTYNTLKELLDCPDNFSINKFGRGYDCW